MSESLPAKLLSEVIQVAFNFTSLLEWGDVITSADVTVIVFSGEDASPLDMLSGVPGISGDTVTQAFQLGHPGVVYVLQCTVNTTGGSVISQNKYLVVLSDDGSYLPSNLVRLVGTLPNASIGVPYSEPLDIIGGYAPYTAAGVASGTAPFWMNFHVVGNQLICDGTPNESVTTEYIFSPQIRDSAANLADAPQDMLSTRLEIFGDVPSGLVGTVVSGSYNHLYGQAPVVYTVVAGTFPTGVSLNTDGTYSGTFTTGGAFSWTVQGTDAVGNIAYADDTCNVGALVWWLTTGNSTVTDGQSRAWNSTDPSVWINPVNSRSPNVDPVYGPIGLYSGVLLIWGNSSYERITNISTNPLATTIITIPSFGNVRFVREFSGFIFTSDQSGPYWVSTDNALTWTKYNSPNGSTLDVLDLAQLSSGRWVTATYGAPRRAWYSNQSIPTSWTLAGSVGSGECLVSSGSCVILWGASSYNRTEDGVVWSTISAGFSPSNSLGAYGSGTFVCSGPSGSVAVSTDDGLTFSTVSLPAGTTCSSIQYISGMFIVTAEATLQSNYLFLSTDGVTWSTVTLPYDRSSPNQGNCRIGAVYEATP